VTHKVDDFLKYSMYQHMSNDRIDVQNPSESITVVIDAKPPQPRHPYTVVNAYLFKPHENTFFKHLKLSRFVDGIFPLNSKQSVAELASKKLFKGQIFRVYNR
jgi:hypothetical protein